MFKFHLKILYGLIFYLFREFSYVLQVQGEILCFSMNRKVRLFKVSPVY